MIFFILNNIYFLLLEEPILEKKFGKDYLEYKKKVPRWIPRFKPYKPIINHPQKETETIKPEVRQV